MKKKLIITESQYKRLINEQEDDYTEQLLSLINSNDETNLEMVKEMVPGLGIDLVQFLKEKIKEIEPPFLNKFNILGVHKYHIKKILNNINKNNYVEYEYGVIKFYNKKDKLIYFEYSDGYWSKTEYDSNNNIIYWGDSDGEWVKQEYDSNNREIYYVTSDGYWIKREYDLNGNQIYSENSNGEIEDNR